MLYFTYEFLREVCSVLGSNTALVRAFYNHEFKREMGDGLSIRILTL